MSEQNPVKASDAPGLKRMVDIREPMYREGQFVCAAVDLANDGSHPDAAPDALLVSAGARGEIVQVGQHVDANIPIYMVEFVDGAGAFCVVGCFEEEIAPA